MKLPCGAWPEGIAWCGRELPHGLTPILLEEPGEILSDLSLVIHSRSMANPGNILGLRPKGVTLREVAEALGLYPLEAFEFVQAGLAYTAGRLHGPVAEKKSPRPRHVSGPQLAEGLRDYGHAAYGLMARAVLAKWGIRSTLDFGKIVFAMVDAGFLRKQPEDSLEDFRDVYDFDRDFDATYHIQSKL